MEYESAHRIQIRDMSGQPNDLKYDENRGDDTPLCGTINRDFEGQPVDYADAGPGTVTCGLCARIVDANPHAGPKAQGGGRRQAGEDAARAERVVRIRESGVRLALPDSTQTYDGDRAQGRNGASVHRGTRNPRNPGL